MTIWAIVPAAGVGRRMGPSNPEQSTAPSPPKQYRQLHGRAVLSHSLAKLMAVEEIASIIVLVSADDQYWQALPEADSPRIQFAEGGAERQVTVLNGLRQLGDAQPDDWVLVHDAVRPCIRVADILNLIASLRDHEVGGLLAAPAENTLKKADADNQVVATVDRRELWNALTPQMFRFAQLRDALEQAVAANKMVTDEAAAIEMAGLKPKLVAGDKTNIKITNEGDLALSELILQMQEGEDE